VSINFRGPRRGVYYIDRRRLNERGVYSHNCNKLNKTNTLLAKISRELKKKKQIADYQLHKLIRLGCQEIHIALSNPNIDVRILAQGYCVVIVSLSLLRS